MPLKPMNTPFAILLAPMAGVTDMPFRRICREMGCDLAYTEMVSAKGLRYQSARSEALLETAPDERPCGAQIFGSDPAIMADMARQIEEKHAGEIALIDINMGCPARKITSNAEGSALMRDLPQAARIIESVAKAVALPVTVKFRKGWDESCVNAVAFAQMAEQSGAAAVGVHGRTAAQGYTGRADWDIIRAVKAAVRVPVWGNGDVFEAEDALRMRALTGCDGVLVARGAQGNPFIFREIKALLEGGQAQLPSTRERVETALRHLRMQDEYHGAHGVIEMRKHIAWYIRGMKNAAQLRVKINACLSLGDMETLLNDFAAEQ